MRNADVDSIECELNIYLIVGFSVPFHSPLSQKGWELWLI